RHQPRSLDTAHAVQTTPPPSACGARGASATPRTPSLPRGRAWARHGRIPQARSTTMLACGALASNANGALAFNRPPPGPPAARPGPVPTTRELRLPPDSRSPRPLGRHRLNDNTSVRTLDD